MSLTKRLTKCDSYGEAAAKLNLSGEDTMRTLPGAIITIVLNIFLLYTIVQTSIAMVTYADMEV